MRPKSIFTTRSAVETEAFGAKLARQFLQQKIFLFGDLGAGKTTFVRGFARGLGVKNKVKSPTFVYEREFRLPNRQKLFHLDLYRVISLPAELAERLKELFVDEKATVIVEWSERIPKKFLPRKRVEIVFKELMGGIKLNLKVYS